ncbi:MAG TPA: chemotaxis protein CheB, partial [Terriglobia bacterium]|nr:chemotaxis protein CheB [Terriglobia bacterium]
MFGNRHFPIVGIGASAGGLEALTSLLQALPVDTGLAFVIIQHLDPKHESMLPDILARSTRMPV